MTDSSPTIAVTGGAGYIGSRVVAEVQREHPDWNLRVLDNFYEGDLRRIGSVTVEDVDVRDRDALEATLDGADVVLHLAAISGVEDCADNPDLTYETNVQGTNNVAWFCRRTGAAMVFPYSMAVLGDPETFPITTDHPRSPMNWYGRTKYISERSIESFADDAFPAHLLMKSNLYGEHHVDGSRVSKSTVINFFVDRALSEEPLTVYEPGTQSRNYVHVKDVATAYLRCTEALLSEKATGRTGATSYEIASEESLSVMTVANLVATCAREECGLDPTVELVQNPRGSETLVEKFSVDTSRAATELDWEPDYSVESSVRALLRNRTG
jgi:UDP-glucose 4-epimerase